MLCPDCGRSDGLCDCLLAAAPPKATDAAEAPRNAQLPGTSAEARAGVVIDERSGLDARIAPGAAEAGARSDWADSLLQFVRDFSSVSPRTAPAATAGQSGRNRPVGRGPAEQDSGRREPLAFAGGRPPFSAPMDDRTGVSGSAPLTPPPGRPPSADSPQVSPLRIAPFVRAQSADEPKAALPATSVPAASTSAPANAGWSGREFERSRAGAPGRSQ
jgi:hypothetical protein